MRFYKNLLFIVITSAYFYACAPADGNQTGHEYMPDMAHSIAVEANVYTNYYLNTWDEESTLDLKSLSIPKEPVNGTIPRGYAGYQLSDNDDLKMEMMETLRGERSVNEIAVPINGNVPYHYENTEEERLRATAEIIANPFPITEGGLSRGKDLYNIFCGICHGENGDGLGYLANPDENKNVKYQAVPANFLIDPLLNTSNGQYYHAIMYGKNVMGAYKDKLSYEERWQVIHYIRSLQAKSLGVAYNAEENAMNPDFGIPYAEIEAAMERNNADALQNEAGGEAAPGENDEHAGESHGTGDHH